MQNQTFAAHVHDIFGRGLDLHERLQRGDPADFRVEHERLRKLLWGDGEVAANPEYVGEPAAQFFGARYALACWLDELFILDSPWGRRWAEVSMEVELVKYGSQDRAWRFWTQAEDAARRPGTDALEVYLWCAMLGFHGEPGDEKAGGLDPTDWAERTRKHLIKSRHQRFPHEAGNNPTPNVPTLGGRRQFVRMLRVATIAAAAAVFFVAYKILK